MTKIIIANHKMNLMWDEAEKYVCAIKNKKMKNLVICPSFVYLPLFKELPFNLGSQNVSFKNKNITGEISVSQLKSMKVKYVIIGHSERRKYLDESFQEINQKIKLTLEEKMIPIVCIGETRKERDENLTIDIIKGLLDIIFTDINSDKIIIAYEPIWSIGSNEIAANDELDLILKFIKSYVLDNYNAKIKVIYGGSVDENSISRLNEIKSLNGFLIGNASLDVHQLEKIYKITNKA